MRQITKTFYAALDATEFDTAAECKAYERDHAHLAIVGLTLEQARAVASREDAERAEAVELLGKQIEKARLAAGELRRRRSQASEPEPEAAASEIPITPPGQLFTPQRIDGEAV